MKRENYLTDNEDLLFHVGKRLDIDSLYAWLSDDEKEAVGAENAADYKSSWMEVLDTFGSICADIGSRAHLIEDEPIYLENGEVVLPPTIGQNMKILQEFGIAGFSIPPQFGGMGAPFVFDMIGCELLNRACPSTMLNSAWFGPIANIIELFGDEALKNEYIPRIATGEIAGNMSLTEPDAGSDLGALRSYGVKQPDGTYQLHGTKRFISNGNSSIALVLAKTEKNGEGLHALSLFLCPRKIENKENYRISNLEKKVALHGSATCELVFDGSKAWLLGKENHGYRYMLQLMNDSRIGVGFQGIGLMEAAYREAKSYAWSRRSWGKYLAEHELIGQKLLDMEVELRAVRSLGLHAAMQRTMERLGERYLASCPRKEQQLVRAKLKTYQQSVRAVTPLLKFWTGERSVAFARNAYQVLGGYGFTKEYRAEWYLRESLIYSVYEGTTQMQALMCMKDTLKEVVREPRVFVQAALADSYRSFVERDGLHKKLFQIKQICNRSVVDILLKLVRANMRISLSRTSKADLLKLAKVVKTELTRFDDLGPALANAERLCALKSLAAMAEATVIDSQVDKGRRWIAQRFCQKALLEAQYLREQIDSYDAKALSDWVPPSLDEHRHATATAH